MDIINLGDVSATQLKSFIERLERLEEDKASFVEQIKETFAEAKSAGFDPKIMRQVLKMRRMKQEELAEQETLLELYCQALGMVS